MDNLESKAYSWAWVTGDRRLTQGPCELLGAFLVVSAASTDTVLYNGVDTSGEEIVVLESAAVTTHPFKPPVPIYCSKGLFVAKGTSVTGILVQWRNL